MLVFSGVAFVIDIADAVEVGIQLDSGPNVDIVGRFGLYRHYVGVQVLRMDLSVTSREVFGVTCFSSEGYA
jgi:xanthosine utilization system XapX-like protein